MNLSKVFFSIVISCFTIGMGSLSSQLLNDTLKIDEVVVSGMRVEVARKNLPVNISVISEDKIDEIEESAILPLISRMTPSLFVNERGVTGFGRTGSSSAGSISIRGIGGDPNARVLVLVDGHPQYMGIFGHPLPNNYVASDLEKVEVIRGPASILYGSNAMGGVINLITREQKKDGVSGSMRLGLGSYNTNKIMANAGVKKGKYDFFFSYNHDKTDGHREDMDFRIDNAYAKAGYKINDKLKLAIDFNIADMTSSDPGMQDSIVDPFIADMVRGKTSISLSNNFKKVEGGIFAFMNFGEHSFSDGWESVDENSGISIYEGISLFNGSLVTVGLDYKDYGGRGNSGYPDNANRWLSVSEAGTYIIARQNLWKDKFVISAGIRYDHHSLFGGQWIPQGGIAAHISETATVKASASKGYRSPTIMELYLFAPNPDLLPEESNNYEIGYSNSYLGGKLNAELTLYLVEGNNLIEIDYTSTPYSRKNTGEFNHKGFEIEANYLISNQLKFDMSYSYLDMKNPKLMAPENQLFAGLRFDRGKFSLAVQSNYIAGLYLTTTETEGIGKDIKEDYFVLNASMKYRLLKHVQLFLSGKNLLNADYMIDYGYPMPGINFMAGAGIRF